jgi:hypothetical protein
MVYSVSEFSDIVSVEQPYKKVQLSVIISATISIITKNTLKKCIAYFLYPAFFRRNIKSIAEKSATKTRKIPTTISISPSEKLNIPENLP